MKVQHWGRAWGLAALCCAVAASAQASVLERVAGGGKLVIAYRESSVPFSYIDSQSGKPVGYALDLCLRMAELVRKKTGKKDMEVELVPVTPANRIAVIEQGKADMECGSTTNNAERRQKVAFTIPHFITGARLLVKSASTIDRVEDLNGKKLVSTKGTTPLKAADQANRERLMGITIVEAPDHAHAHLAKCLGAPEGLAGFGAFFFARNVCPVGGGKRDVLHFHGRPFTARTGIFFPMNTVAITASAKPRVTASSRSPSRGTANSMPRNGCTSCTWLTRTVPPRARPRYHAKNPSHIENTAT